MTDVLPTSTNGIQVGAPQKKAPQFFFGGMFNEFKDSVFSTYAGAITWRDRVAGGTPSDPRLIEAWIGSKMPGMTSDTERRYMLLKTLREMGTEIPEVEEGADPTTISMERLEEAASKVAASKGANGFKRPNRKVRTEIALDPKTQKEVAEAVVEVEGYLAIETRHLKSGLDGALAA